MELWDGYFADGTLAGTTLIRGEEIPKGLFHIVVEVLVRHVDGDYLLMQRSMEKEGYAGYFEASAGGSVLKGEAPEDGASRELFEETGILADTLQRLSVTVSTHTVFHSYMCVTAVPKDSITLQEETMAYQWVDEATFRAFIHSEDSIPPQRERLKKVEHLIFEEAKST